MPQLSVCIPARNEEWLPQTVEDVLANSTADTEVIVVLDGVWPKEPLPQHPKLQVIFVPKAIGQRAATNLAARVSTAKYLVKLDAHCSVAHGWDTELIKAAEELGPNVVQIPAQLNLHVFDWVCDSPTCGRREYQCGLSACRACNGPIHKEVVWTPRRGVRTIRWRFDSELHFQYWDKPAGEFVETMSCLGACWFISKAQWEAIDGLDEDHGSWGQVGTELGCKVWLSGGRMVTNTRTSFSHFFRVGGQQFPYAITGSEQEYARQYSRNLWRGNNWPKQIKPLRWLVEKFWPVNGWTEEQRDALPEMQSRHATERGVEIDLARHPEETGRDQRSDRPAPIRTARASKGLVYYSDCRGDDAILRAVRERLTDIAPGPVIGVVLKPVQWSEKTIVLNLERGYLTMFKQILAGLEALDTDLAFLVEHDVLYHPSHFDFTPPDRSKVYYNQNVWKVDAETGKALHYRCSQTSGLCADRTLLVEHYRRRVEIVQLRGYTRNMGFEPGTHGRAERVDDLQAEAWLSEYPNVDIRHGSNLTPSRWKKSDFRNQKFTAGWTEASVVPGWGQTQGRFRDFLAEVGRAAQQAVA